MNDLPPILRQNIARLRALVRTALEEFQRDHRTFRARYTSRTEASIIHDYMVWNAKAVGFPWKLRRNLFLFRLGQDYAVKPKRLDRYLRPRNIQTQLVLRYDEQRATRLFDDIDLTHLYLGYQLAGAEILTASIWLVCPDGRNIRWAAELRAEDASAPVEVAVPETPTLPTGTEERRIKPKTAAEKLRRTPKAKVE